MSSLVCVVAGGDVDWTLDAANADTGIYYDDSWRGYNGTQIPKAVRAIFRRVLWEQERTAPIVYKDQSELGLKAYWMNSYASEFHSNTAISWPDHAKRANFDPFQNLRNLFGRAHIGFANLECVVSGHYRRAGPHHAAVEFLDVLKSSGISVVSLANNHALDGDEVGLLNTMAQLHARGIRTAGCGRTLEEALRPAILEINGVRVGILACSNSMNVGPSGFASPNRSGVAPMDVALIKRQLEAHAPHTRILLSIHWGKENQRRILPEMRAWAHTFIDSGACAIIGHGPHIPLGCELYRGAPIFYSLGNLVFGHGHSYWTDNIVTELYIGPQNVAAACVYPIEGTGDALMQPNFASGRRASELRKAFLRMSRLAGITPKKFGDSIVIDLDAAK